MNPLSPEQQVRFNLATKLPINTVNEAEEIYKWVMGTKSSILPVSNFEVVK